MAETVRVERRMLVWACERAQREPVSLKVFKELEEALANPESEGRVPYAKLLRFANSVHIPINYLFLKNPIEETLPIEDLRTVGSVPSKRPSVELLDIVNLCLLRQDWYRNWMIRNDEPPWRSSPLASVKDDPEEFAEKLRKEINLPHDGFSRTKDEAEAIREFSGLLESAGILVMISGQIGMNTHRTLDVEEIRGFALSDDYAPVIFVNGRDSTSAQVFTMAHELAHIWLGDSVISNPLSFKTSQRAKETWCNRVAGALVVPAMELISSYNASKSIEENLDPLRNRFKVSSLVILYRLYQLDFFETEEEFDSIFSKEQQRLRALARPKREKKGDRGPNVYLLLLKSLGRRFSRALVSDAIYGDTSLRDAFEYTGIKKAGFDGLRKLGQVAGVAV